MSPKINNAIYYAEYYLYECPHQPLNINHPLHCDGPSTLKSNTNLMPLCTAISSKSVSFCVRLRNFRSNGEELGGSDGDDDAGYE